MQKSKPSVTRTISTLQQIVYDQEVFYGLPVLAGQDGQTWTMCCKVFVVGSEQASKQCINDIEELQSILLSVGRSDVIVEVESIRTTLTGKVVRSGKHVFENGTNIGKKNETSTLQAAVVFMQAAHRKMSKAKQPAVQDVYTEEQPIPKVNPMLLGLYKYQSSTASTANAAKSDKKGNTGTSKAIQFPCFVQRKYDGLRCIAVVSSTGEVQLQSRGQCVYTNLKHINEFIAGALSKQLINIQKGQFLFLDGELYAHGLSLQKINSLIKNDSADTSLIQLRVFDGGYVHLPDTPFNQRIDFVRSVLGDTQICEGQPAQVVPSLQVDSEQAVDQLMREFLAEGYEGAVLRAFDSPYVFSVSNRRSDSTLKYKKRDDLEVQVIGYASGQGRDSGAVVYVCRYQDKEFNVVQNATLQTRKKQFDFLQSNEWALECLKNIPLTVEFAGFSDTGIPLQPRGTLFRFDLATNVLPDRLQVLKNAF